MRSFVAIVKKPLQIRCNFFTKLWSLFETSDRRIYEYVEPYYSESAYSESPEFPPEVDTVTSNELIRHFSKKQRMPQEKICIGFGVFLKKQKSAFVPA